MILTFDPLSLNIISTSNIVPKPWKSHRHCLLYIGQRCINIITCGNQNNKHWAQLRTSCSISTGGKFNLVQGSIYCGGNFTTTSYHWRPKIVQPRFTTLVHSDVHGIISAIHWLAVLLLHLILLKFSHFYRQIIDRKLGSELKSHDRMGACL